MIFDSSIPIDSNFPFLSIHKHASSLDNVVENIISSLILCLKIQLTVLISYN